MALQDQTMSAASQNVPNKLVSCLYSQKQSDKYCDMKLRLGEVVISAHACVVGSFSPYIDNLVTTGEVMLRVAGSNIEVDVPLTKRFDCQPCASKVLDFMYLGKIQIHDHHLQHIQEISNALQVSELIRICDKHSEKCEFLKKSRLDIVSEVLDMTPLASTDGTDKGESDFPFASSNDEQLISANEQDTLSDIIHSEILPAVDGSKAKHLSVNEDSFFSIPLEKEWSGLTCPKCHMMFMSIVKFQQHCSTHLGRIYTTCFVCNFATLKVPDLIKHLREKDHGERVCSLCLYEASSSLSLKEHLQQHDHLQPFFCQTCNTRFQTRTALNSHIVKHSSETPFCCKECGRGFKWKHGLQSHMVTHTSVKKLLCDQCGFSTAHLKSFIDHKSVHSGETFKCPVADCKFKSVRKESVKQHLSTHSKEKTYQCEICGQAFSQSKNLRRHAAIHDPGVGREQCPLCSFQTTRSDKFRDHFRLYHKDNESSAKLKGKKTKTNASTINKNKRKSRKKNAGASSPSNSRILSNVNNLVDESLTCRQSELHTSPSDTTLGSTRNSVVLPPVTTLPLPSNSTTISVLTYPNIDVTAIPINVFNEGSQLVTAESGPFNVTLFPEQINSVLAVPSMSNGKELGALSDSASSSQCISVCSESRDSDAFMSANQAGMIPLDNTTGATQNQSSVGVPGQIVILNDSSSNTSGYTVSDSYPLSTIILSRDGNIVVMGNGLTSNFSQDPEFSLSPDLNSTSTSLIPSVEDVHCIQSFVPQGSSNANNGAQGNISLNCNEDVGGLEVLDECSQVSHVSRSSVEQNSDAALFNKDSSQISTDLQLENNINHIPVSIGGFEIETEESIAAGGHSENETLNSLLDLETTNSICAQNDIIKQNQVDALNHCDTALLAPAAQANVSNVLDLEMSPNDSIRRLLHMPVMTTL